MPLTPNEIDQKIAEFCPSLSEISRKVLFKICTYKSVENKEIILDTSVQKRMTFLGLTGVFRGYTVDESGKEHVLVLRPSGIFLADSFAVFKNAPQNLFFEAIGPGDVLLIDFDDFENLTQSHPEVMMLYLNILKEAICTLTYRVKTMTNMSHEKRYLDLLQQNPSFLKEAYHKHIANYLGITPVSLSRIINRNKKKKN